MILFFTVVVLTKLFEMQYKYASHVLGNNMDNAKWTIIRCF